MLYTPAMSAREREEETAHSRIFMEFMAGVVRFEELADGGRGVLARFHKELEYFRRQWVPIESDVMDEIVRSNCTHRMRSYLESGCSLHYQNISNLRHSNVVLKRLECLVEDAYDATLTANLSAVKVLDYSSADSKMKHEKQEQPADQLDRDSSLVTVMILVHNMLKLDYTMQEKIVRSLSLKSSSTELESYRLMWDLRPYVDGISRGNHAHETLAPMVAG